MRRRSKASAVNSQGEKLSSTAQEDSIRFHVFMSSWRVRARGKTTRIESGERVSPNEKYLDNTAMTDVTGLSPAIYSVVMSRRLLPDLLVPGFQ
jgi:hypothetical protein